jgi:hypothetical protein
VGPEVYKIFGALFNKKNKKLGTKVNIYLEREKKSEQIRNLKRLKNSTKIKKSRNITQYFY